MDGAWVPWHIVGTMDPHGDGDVMVGYKVRVRRVRFESHSFHLACLTSSQVRYLHFIEHKCFIA
jgi:hypothetical protein